MIQHLETDARLRDKKGQHSFPAPDTRARTDGEKVSGKRESSSDVRRRIPCSSLVSELQVQTTMRIWKRCFFQHVEAEENPNNK